MKTNIQNVFKFKKSRNDKYSNTFSNSLKYNIKCKNKFEQPLLKAAKYIIKNI